MERAAHLSATSPAASARAVAAAAGRRKLDAEGARDEVDPAAVRKAGAILTALAEIHSGLVSTTLIEDAAEATTRLISGPTVGRPLRS
eukprot:COSAG02_NODE_1536_length_12051_cov_8.897674_5_plen_88_part_00